MKERFTGRRVDHPVVAWKRLLAMLGQQAVVRHPEVKLLNPERSAFAPFSARVAVELEFRLPRPKKYAALPLEADLALPDVDNLAKAVLDAWNGILWNDDRQVCRLVVTRIAVPEESSVGMSATLRTWSPA